MGAWKMEAKKVQKGLGCGRFKIQGVTFDKQEWSVTLPKFNMEPEKDGFSPKRISFFRGWFLGYMLNFRGCVFVQISYIS